MAIATADLVTDGHTDMPIGSFGPERFSAGSG
jgi:hypothetical protein